VHTNFSSLLLSARGYDVQKVLPKLESLSSAKSFEPLEPIRDTDIQVQLTVLCIFDAVCWIYLILLMTLQFFFVKGMWLPCHFF